MAKVSDAQFRQLKKFMDDSSLTCTQEWMVACVNWIQENYSSVNLEVLKKELRVQWRDSNLQEMESTCLPPNLVGQRLAKLPGKYGLQVNSIRDIGESSFNQFNKLKKLENENVSVAATDSNEYKPSWQPTPKRCLYLTMTDGKQTVFGMEMQPISGLSLNMKPGVKIVVIGPVECRRGIFHLRPNNVRVEGGEVEELLEANKTEKILADILKIDPTDSRYIRRTPGVGPNSINPSQASSVGATISSGASISGDFPDSDDQFPDEAFGGDDDDIFMEIDEEALIRSASAPSTTSTSSSNPTSGRGPTKTSQAAPSRTNTNSNFTDDIEDFEDDPGFTSSVQRNTSYKQAAPSRVVSSVVPTPKPVISATKSTSSSNTVKKPKPVFVPPIVKESTSPAPATSTSAAGKMLAPQMFATSSKKASSVKKNPSSADSKIEKTSAVPGFKSAKTALPATAKGSSAGGNGNGNGKQMKILSFMKPMPVIIDPPTPERKIKRRRKSIEEGVTIGEQAQVPPVPFTIKQEQDCDMIEEERTTSSHQVAEPFETEAEEGDPFDNCEDEALMRIVDEAVENRLSERMDEEYEEEEDSPAPAAQIYPSNLKSNASASTTATRTRLSYPVQVSEHPYNFIPQIQENYNELASMRKVVKVKGCISTVVSNIRVDNGSWALEVCINDGMGYMNCQICSSLIMDIIGFSPPEMKAIKAQKTKEGKQRIAQAMSGLASRLTHVNGIFSIEIGEQPVIIEITDLMLHHSTASKGRMTQIGL